MWVSVGVVGSDRLKNAFNPNKYTYTPHISILSIHHPTPPPNIQEMLQRLQGCGSQEEVASLLTERCRELEEGNTELEYRMRERDMRVDEVSGG